MTSTKRALLGFIILLPISFIGLTAIVNSHSYVIFTYIILMTFMVKMYRKDENNKKITAELVAQLPLPISEQRTRSSQRNIFNKQISFWWITIIPAVFFGLVFLALITSKTPL